MTGLPRSEVDKTINLGIKQPSGTLMVIVRFVGWIFVVAGALVVGLDFLVSIASAHWTPNAVGDLWWRVDPSSYSLVRGYLGRTIFEFWAAVALLAGGLLLILLENRR